MPIVMLAAYGGCSTVLPSVFGGDCDFDLTAFGQPNGTLARHVCPLLCGDCTITLGEIEENACGIACACGAQLGMDYGGNPTGTDGQPCGYAPIVARSPAEQIAERVPSLLDLVPAVRLLRVD